MTRAYIYYGGEGRGLRPHPSPPPRLTSFCHSEPQVGGEESLHSNSFSEHFEWLKSVKVFLLIFERLPLFLYAWPHPVSFFYRRRRCTCSLSSQEGVRVKSLRSFEI